MVAMDRLLKRGKSHYKLISLTLSWPVIRALHIYLSGSLKSQFMKMATLSWKAEERGNSVQLLPRCHILHLLWQGTCSFDVYNLSSVHSSIARSIEVMWFFATVTQCLLSQWPVILHRWTWPVSIIPGLVRHIGSFIPLGDICPHDDKNS